MVGTLSLIRGSYMLYINITKAPVIRGFYFLNQSMHGKDEQG